DRARQPGRRQDPRDHAGLPDGDGHRRLRTEVAQGQPEGSEGAGRLVLRGGGHDQGRPRQVPRDHGCGREAVGRAVRQVGGLPALVRQGRQPAVLREGPRAFHEGRAGDPARGRRDPQGARRPQRHLRHQLHQVMNGTTMSATPAMNSSEPVIAAGPAAVAAAPRRRRAFVPLEPVGAQARWMLGLGFFMVFVVVWGFFTLGGFVSPTFLASPVTMVKEGISLFTEFNFLHDIRMTVWRVFGGFVLAAVIAVPLGIAMGTWKGVEAFFEPFVSFCRYLPASAFIPLLILWAGI